MLTNVEAKESPAKGHETADKDDVHEGSDSESDNESFRDEESYEDPLNKYMIRMLNLAREVALFCFVLVAYAALTHDPPKISKPPAAYPFFRQGSPVTDWYRGHMSKAIELARTSDMSFVMYYAPWDAECQAAREHFEAAAVYMEGRVQFAAVNCWQPHGECRTQYNKVYRWPVLIAYSSNGRGVQYSGPITAPHLIGFLERVLSPIKRAGRKIYDYEEAYLVANLNVQPGSREYGVYYQTALRYLERDPLARITFYVRSVKSSEMKLSLHLWHQVRMIEFERSEWQSEKIIQWIFDQLEQPSSWVAPTSAKSVILSSHLQNGPALVMFTPNNPLHNGNDYYYMLQQIAQEYKNCDSWGLNFDIPEKRSRNLLEYRYLKRNCPNERSVSKSKIISVVRPQGWTNVSKVNLPFENQIAHICENFLDISSDDVPDITCENSKRDFTKSYKTSMLQPDDYRSMENLARLAEKERCRLFLAAEKVQPANFETDYGEGKEDAADVAGLACKTNKSLNFVAMDSLLYYNFAENLGVDLSKRKDKSAIVIVDEKRESHYVMDEPVTSVNLKKFILKFTKNQLARSFDCATSVKSKSTHSYRFSPKTVNDSRTVYVEELNARNFMRTVSKRNQAVVVMYYSKQCSFCNGISYTFLTLARKLSFVENLMFARIDGDLNVLPWEYTMETFPTILFFPANKKSESRVFPSELFVTVPNLLGFVLTNLDRNSRLQAIYSLCIHTQLKRDRSTCLANLRNETLSVIEETLKDWRKSNDRLRQLVLRNLKLLKQLHGAFGHSSDDYSTVQGLFRKLNRQIGDDYRLGSVKDEL